MTRQAIVSLGGLCVGWFLTLNFDVIAVTGNILYCLDHGCQLGWLIDPEDSSILVFRPNQQPEFLQDDERLPVLTGIDLELKVAQVFGWIKMSS